MRESFSNNKLGFPSSCFEIIDRIEVRKKTFSTLTILTQHLWSKTDLFETNVK